LGSSDSSVLKPGTITSAWLLAMVPLGNTPCSITSKLTVAVPPPAATDRLRMSNRPAPLAPPPTTLKSLPPPALMLVIEPGTNTPGGEVRRSGSSVSEKSAMATGPVLVMVMV
jgi:hypothetical protein